MGRGRQWQAPSRNLRRRQRGERLVRRRPQRLRRPPPGASGRGCLRLPDYAPRGVTRLLAREPEVSGALFVVASLVETPRLTGLPKRLAEIRLLHAELLGEVGTGELVLAELLCRRGYLVFCDALGHDRPFLRFRPIERV